MQHTQATSAYNDVKFTSSKDNDTTANGFSHHTGSTRLELKRIIKPKLLDFEYALWQMRLLLTHGPKKIYRHCEYRKQTKNQWARDDPTFCVLSCIFVALCAIGYCFMYETRGDCERVVGDYVGRVFRLYRVRVRDRDGVLVLGEQVYDDENEKRRE